MVDLIKSFVRDESGATAIEYGLIAALISVVAIGAFRTTGTGVRTAMTNVGTALR